ncbi:MAG TPA: hypothetical protein VJ437_11770 [Acidiferrobacterales bacterium]|nr:hypothetical protein [Acidiferrobacterales bacterium]
MSTLPDKTRQIIQAHAGLIHAVVAAAQNRERLPELEALLDAALANGWGTLVAVIRRILGGTRDVQILTGLDEEDRVIAEAILHGLQDPGSLPDPHARPDPALAGPGLAALIHAAGSGDVAALQLLADMGTQMLRAGGDLARLSGILRRLVDHERDPDLLCRGMSPRGAQLVRSLLEELARLRAH